MTRQEDERQKSLEIFLEAAKSCGSSQASEIQLADLLASAAVQGVKNERELNQYADTLFTYAKKNSLKAEEVVQVMQPLVVYYQIHALTRSQGIMAQELRLHPKLMPYFLEEQKEAIDFAIFTFAENTERDQDRIRAKEWLCTINAVEIAIKAEDANSDQSKMNAAYVQSLCQTFEPSQVDQHYEMLKTKYDDRLAPGK